MKCPICKEPYLAMMVRFGIEINYCPRCRGVWLDRGELDKIIEKSMETNSQPAAGEVEIPVVDPFHEDHSRHDEPYKHDDRRGRK